MYTPRTLAETERQLRLALAAGRVGTWSVDLRSFRLTSSREHSAILGLDSSTHDVNEVAQRLVHPDDRDAVNAAWLSAALGCVPFSAEYRIIRPDGLTRWVEVRGETERDAITDEPSVFVGVMVDVTERKEREDQFRAITELAPQFVWLADAEGRTTYANGALLAHLGAEQQAFVGSSWVAFLHPNERANVEREWLAAIAAGTPLETEYRMRSADGTDGWFLTRATPIRGKPGGLIERWLGVSVDISGRKKAEDALNFSVQELIRERDLRERFVTTLTHDLRTPLSTAKLSANFLMLSDATTEQKSKATERLARSLDRVSQMISDLLDASRLKSGHALPIACEQMDMTEVVSETLNDLRQLHGDRFVMEAAGPIVGIWDKNAVRRIIENLAQNAVKYGVSAGRITITINERTTGVGVSVHNAGDAIPVAEQSKLFLPVQRALSAETGPARGWGLGLAVVKGLVEAHRGAVAVTSSPTAGTVFFIDLPRDTAMANSS